MSNENKVPRRAHLELNIPAELAIRSAITTVEELGCNENLTKVVIQLGSALLDLSNWYDGGAIGASQNVSLIDMVRGDSNVSADLKAALATKPKLYDPAAVAQMREDIHRLSVEAGTAIDFVRKFVEIMDSEEDGGEGVFEDRMERLLPEARSLLK